MSAPGVCPEQQLEGVVHVDEAPASIHGEEGVGDGLQDRRVADIGLPGAVLVLELLAAELGVDARPQHLQPARGGDVVVGSAGDGLQHQRVIVGLPEEHERQLAPARVRLHLAAGRERGRQRLGDVDHQAVHLVDLQQLERLGRGGGHHHVVPVLSELLGDVLGRRCGGAEGEDPLRREQPGGRPRRERGRAPQEHLQPGQHQLLPVRLLAHVGVGAGLEGPQLAHLPRRGEEDARGGAERRIGAEPPHEARAVHARHVAVDDHRARLSPGGHAQPFLARCGGGHLEPRLLQHLAHLLARGHAVVDDQHRAAADRLAAGCGGRALGAADELARARHHLSGVVGLADVLVGAGLQAADAVLHLGLGGEEHHRRRAVLAASA